MNAWCNDLSGFARGIVQGREIPPGMLIASANYTAATAIGIYRNNYHGNLHDALAGAYPILEQLVGADFFRMLARQFIAQHPSRSGNLYHYGVEMAHFVASFKPAQELPYLPDVAALEWACHCAWFADDADALDILRFAQMAPEHYADMVLHIHPACRVVRSRYPVASIWHVHQPGMCADFHIALDSGPCIALVSRKDDVVRVSEMGEADAAWLQHIQAGASLGDATAATLDLHPDFDLQDALQNLVTQNILTDFNLRNFP